jgi:hypothetical protein
MQKLEGVITIKRITRGHVMTGFTNNDFHRLRHLARKVYKLQTKRKRTVNKYVKRLLHESLRDYVNKIK